MDQAQRTAQSVSDIKLSKLLSWLLRHGAETAGMVFDEGGFLDVLEILKFQKFRSYNLEDVLRVVEENEKKRFSVRYKNEGSRLQIRANQGHSLHIAEEEFLTLLTEDTVPPAIYHGTYFNKLKSIRKNGLSRKKRIHIHFTPVFPGQGAVLSGIRGNCEVVIVVDTLKAMRDGFKFYQSDNGVILCKGNDVGLIPPLYFKEIWQLSPLQRLA